MVEYNLTADNQAVDTGNFYAFGPERRECLLN